MGSSGFGDESVSDYPHITIRLPPQSEDAPSSIFAPLNAPAQHAIPKRKHPYQADEEEPWRFSENNKRYRICCGCLHAKTVIILLTVLKTCFVLWYAIWRLILLNNYAMFALSSIFGLSLILSSYAFLIIGVIVKRYKLLIPYFTLSLFLILILMMKLFIDVLGTANTKDTLESEQLQLIMGQTAVIAVEIYSVFVVWNIFNYITDYYMEKDYMRNVKVAAQRKRWQMEYTKGFDEYLLEIEKEEEKELAKTTAKDETAAAESAEPYLHRKSRASIHKSSQHSTTTSSD